MDVKSPPKFSLGTRVYDKVNDVTGTVQRIEFITERYNIDIRGVYSHLENINVWRYTLQIGEKLYQTLDVYEHNLEEV